MNSFLRALKIIVNKNPRQLPLILNVCSGKSLSLFQAASLIKQVGEKKTKKRNPDIDEQKESFKNFFIPIFLTNI